MRLQTQVAPEIQKRLLFYSIMLRAVLGLFPYLGKDFYVL